MNKPTTTMNTNSNMSLDIDAPDKVGAVLREAAQAYFESAGELESAWQDKNAGKAWAKIARILEQAADKIDKLEMY